MEDFPDIWVLQGKVYEGERLVGEVSSQLYLDSLFIRKVELSMDKGYTSNDEPYHVVKDMLLKTTNALEHVQNEKDQLDNFIDYLVDKMDGDRVELMKSFLKEMND